MLDKKFYVDENGDQPVCHSDHEEKQKLITDFIVKLVNKDQFLIKITPNKGNSYCQAKFTSQ